ncbi:MAG TPA: DUF4369 domain-containing protein, partial [Lacibacter sp.]|nr:DUF4369 domain-containing protein [Lacibacter sp.]
MKEIVTICLLMSAVLQLQAQQPFSIKGTIRGAKENAKVSLRMDGQDGDALVESMLKNGKFELKGNIT